MSATDAIQNVKQVQAKYWKCMGASLMPVEGELRVDRVVQEGKKLMWVLTRAQSSRKLGNQFPSPVRSFLPVIFGTFIADPDSSHARATQKCSKLIECTNSTTNTTSSTLKSVYRNWKLLTMINCCARTFLTFLPIVDEGSDGELIGLSWNHDRANVYECEMLLIFMHDMYVSLLLLLALSGD